QSQKCLQKMKGKKLPTIIYRKNNSVQINRCGSFPGYQWHISFVIFPEVKGEAGAI
ncbi:unnamed protein product, partial [Bubo scandiacus]